MKLTSSYILEKRGKEKKKNQKRLTKEQRVLCRFDLGWLVGDVVEARILVWFQAKGG